MSLVIVGRASAWMAAALLLVLQSGCRPAWRVEAETRIAELEQRHGNGFERVPDERRHIATQRAAALTYIPLPGCRIGLPAAVTPDAERNDAFCRFEGVGFRGTVVWMPMDLLRSGLRDSSNGEGLWQKVRDTMRQTLTSIRSAQTQQACTEAFLRLAVKGEVMSRPAGEGHWLEFECDDGVGGYVEGPVKSLVIIKIVSDASNGLIEVWLYAAGESEAAKAAWEAAVRSFPAGIVLQAEKK